MPKLTCTGFSMFAQHMRISLEAERGRRFGGMDDQLISAVTPLWQQLSSDDKRMWKERARSYKRTDEFMDRRRLVRAKRSPQPRRLKIDSTVFDLDEYDLNEEHLGVPVGQSLSDQDRKDGNGDPPNKLAHDEDPWATKCKQDKDKLKNFFLTATDGSLDDLKRCRFLLVSIQTFGNLDGMCIPAEVALNEFNLKYGIIDQYATIIGPWTMSSAMLKQRASFHANETHKIPLTGCPGVPGYTTGRSKLMREILGRTEPGIARKQGVAVGLYENGMFEFDSDSESDLSLTDTFKFPMDEQRKPAAVGYAKSLKLAALPSDSAGRRWLICLRSEFEQISGALKYLKHDQRLNYDGFPTEPDQFIFAETLVETLAEFVGARPAEDYADWLNAFGKPQPREFATPWEQRTGMFCALHNRERNSCCAVATVRRGCFAIFYALRDAYDLPFGH